MTTTPVHVLVVDDDGDVRDVVKAILEEHGFQVSLAASGREMHQRLDADAVQVVILDVTVPGEPSALLARRALDLGLPVVMISGNLGVWEQYADHQHQLLHKPFQMQELVAAVQRALTSGIAGQRTDADHPIARGEQADRDREQRVRERAYAIWQREGCPSGRDQEHWRRAEREIAAEEEGPAA
jgi:DNA-binding NtrC family response regulator